ncbi:MAG: DUF3459 domain-containing protein [Actinobacteria bacterium]|nr:DUF3459 domain-containing protein [Actinomycetota bacterium]
MEWWQEGVLYQIYPRSFRDTNGDGVGDLRGIIEGLDHLEWLGVDGVWVNPIHPSPNDDWGYDVSAYKDVHPELGTMEDFEELIDDAARRGIRILLDLVPNHTSSAHPWFVDALSGRDAKHRDWYVWSDPKPDGSPPNNWLSMFGGSAWEFDEPSGQYYLHNFLDSQADLDWWNEEVREAIDDVLRFWFDKGVAGFRIDVANSVIKDRDLRDNPPTTDDDHLEIQRIGQRPMYSMNRPEVHEILRRWRKVAREADPPRMLVGETYVLDLGVLASYYGTGDELDLAFNFPMFFTALDGEAMKTTVEQTFDHLSEDSWPVWTGSNHDGLRFPSRWCDGDERKIRIALMMLLTLRGTPFLYYGDEIGMTNVDITREQLKDPVGIRFFPENPGRDPGRTPMQWSADDGAGFTKPDVSPWLPLGDHRSVNVADQRSDGGSILNFTRDLIHLRRRSEDLRSGEQSSIASPTGTFVYRRGVSTVVVLNMTDAPNSFDVDGEVLVTSTGRALEAGPLELDPFEGAIVTQS